MVLKIEAINEEAPIPRECRVTIECDVAKAFFCRAFIQSETGEGYIGFMSRAVRMGWTERRTMGDRVFVCPECKK